MLGTLEHLDLSENDLEALESDVFKNNRGLKAIVLNFNNLKFIHPSIFDSMVVYYFSMLGPQCIAGDYNGLDKVEMAKNSFGEKCNDTNALETLKYVPPTCNQESNEEKNRKISKKLIIIVCCAAVVIIIIILICIAIGLKRQVRKINKKLQEIQKTVNDEDLKPQNVPQITANSQNKVEAYEIPLPCDENVYEEIDYHYHQNSLYSA